MLFLVQPVEKVMEIQPYLFFDGRADEAIEFYKSKLDAKVEMLMRFKDNPDRPGPESVPRELDDKVMHACVRINGGAVMMSDGHCQGQPTFSGFSLTLNAKDEAEAQRLFGALSEGGQVQMPLGKTFFSPSFGMVADKFGVGWMVIVPQPQ
jgi:PhnB protein